MTDNITIRCSRCNLCITLPNGRHLCEAEHVINEERYPNPPAGCLRAGSFAGEQQKEKEKRK